MVPRPLLDDLLDLVLGRACCQCGEPGRALCATCLASLRYRGLRLPPSGSLPAVHAADRYDGRTRRLIIDYKEESNRALAPMLGVLLADAVEAALADIGADRATLVPVPGHPRPARGFDALGGIARVAAGVLRHRGADTRRIPALRTHHRYPILKTRSRADRAEAVAGAFTASPAIARVRQPVIVIDDVLTTGTTAAECIRALTAARVPVSGIAVIAVTPRRQPG